MRVNLKSKMRSLSLLGLVLGAMTSGCMSHDHMPKGMVLDNRVIHGTSEEIEAFFKSSLAFKYPDSQSSDGYTIYTISHGTNKWLFCKAYNAPRGLNMFNLYCYESQSSDTWALRAYVPMNLHYFPYDEDQELRFENDGGYLNVLFRKTVIFSVK